MPHDLVGPTNYMNPNEDMSDYHRRWWWLSKSLIDLLLTTPRHLWYKYLCEGVPKQKETRSQSLGTDVHTLILEMHLFEANYMCGPEGKNRTHAPFKKLAADNPDKRVLPYAEYKLLEAIYNSIKQQPIGKYFLDLQGESEVSCYWKDPDLGQLLKCRPDKIIKSQKIVVDIKTTAVLGKHKFIRHAADLNYHRSAALTKLGLNVLTGHDYEYIFLVIEMKPPFNVAAYSFDEEAIALGNSEIDRAIQIFKECQESDNWPGYPSKIQTISMPKWRTGNHG